MISFRLIIVLFIFLNICVIINCQYYPIDQGASCQKYIGDKTGSQLCDGFLSNPDSVYINSTTTQESIQAEAYLVRAYINLKSSEACKSSISTYTLLCAYLFPECSEHIDSVTQKKYAYPKLPCYNNCVNMTTTCSITSKLNCLMKTTTSGATYSVFPNSTTTYKYDSTNFTDTCLNTANIVYTNTTIQKCFPPLVYHVSTNQAYDESIGYIFPTTNATCVVQCPAPLYYANQWRNLYRLSDVLSILSCILTLFLIITLGFLNPKISRFDKINITLVSCIFLQSLSGALMTFNGTENTLCPEPGRFASHIDNMCVTTGFILHGTSLLIVQWWCIMTFEIWITIFQAGKKQKDRFIYYIVPTLIIAWVPPIVAISNNQYAGGPANPFCWLTDFDYRRFSFWLPLGIFLCAGGLLLLLLIREIYIIVTSVETQGQSRMKILKMEFKPMINLVMYFSILLYLFIYDQWINNHMSVYTDSIPEYGLCILTSKDPSTCLLKAPNIAGFGFFIFSLRVFGIYSFLIYGLSSRVIKIWKYNYLVVSISKKIEEFTNATSTARSSNNQSINISSSTATIGNTQGNNDDNEDDHSVELESDD